MKCRSILWSLVLALAASTSIAEDSKTMFPFVLQGGLPSNITNVQTWEGAWKPAGSDGFFFNADGEFATKSGQKRLLGTNFCFGASFCSKEKAERVADTLARYGVGIVRLHHMDSRDIWGKNLSKGTTEIDPEKLERLDYLIYCLKQKGIYVNINLHVSRAFKEIDGFVDASRLPTHNKGVDNFEPKMIELQKKYAKDLLQHVNPHTGLSYADDPCVAVVEINNENSVVASWSWGELDDLPEYYSAQFKQLWNQWLSKKYGSTQALRDAWDCKKIPFGENMVAKAIEPGFAFKNGWVLELDDLTKVNYQVVDAKETGIDAHALRFEVEKMGEVAWRPQFNYSMIALKKDAPYLLRFKVRSEKGAQMSVAVSQYHEPWRATGLSTKVYAEKEWKTIELPFIAIEDDSRMRIGFSGFQEGASFELADVSLREGGTLGFDENLKLEKGEIPLPKKNGDKALIHAQGLADFSDFLHDLEDGYWQDMYKYVKSLDVKSPISGTQLQYGFWYNQARLDYCDIHAYWNHPDFPRRSWDSNDWLIRNTCLANTPQSGTLASLASLRVLGSPFTCSEYDHPYPNQYCAEGNVMLAAVAAFQNWSATFQFAWAHGDNFERDVVTSFFDECSNVVKLAHLPACYGMFARGDVQSGPGEFYYAPSMTEEKEREIMRGSLSSYHRAIDRGLGLDKSLSLAVYSGIELPDLNLPKSDALKKAKKIESWADLPERMGSNEEKKIVNEFGEITWNYQQEGKGFFTVDTANSKAFSGFVTEPQYFDAMALDIGETELGWATVTLVKAINAEKGAKKTGALTPGSYLLTATGLMHNTDAKMVFVDEDKITTAGHFGGSNGVAPILCEGIPAQITLYDLPPKNVEVYALDNRGERAKKLDVEPFTAGSRFNIGPEFKTVWYEIVVK